jgi:hypothetical protein
LMSYHVTIVYLMGNWIRCYTSITILVHSMFEVKIAPVITALQRR